MKCKRNILAQLSKLKLNVSKNSKKGITFESGYSIDYILLIWQKGGKECFVLNTSEICGSTEKN